MERRLAAILAADVVGYSCLMGQDEAGTHARFKALRQDLVAPLIAEHRGRLVKQTGDGFLVAFQSVVDAVACGLAWQQRLIARNADLAEDQRLWFRIGIHLGDIIIEADDIYGDGVNLAARLEALAPPGGLCISQQAFDQVETKLEVRFTELGEQRLKNIARPVRVWAWHPDQAVALSPDPAQSAVAAILADKPSIAVLPFVNMSGDPDQEYFADGITEDILTLLARDRWLAVIARNSTFAYKGRAVDVRDVSKALNANYVLEGSVRKAGLRLRITAQLIDGADGRHIWPERYDGDVAQIFEVQDEITGAIAAAIDPALGHAQRELTRRKPPQSLDARDYCWRGLWHYYKFTDESFAEAERLFEKAISIDPDFAQALACLAYVYIEMAIHEGLAGQLEKAVATAKRAIACDERDAWGHYVLGRALSDGLQYDEAIAEFERAIELNPSFASAYFGLGFTLAWREREREAIDLLAKAERLSPNDPELWHFYDMRSTAHLSLGELDAAETFTRKALRQPNCTFWPSVMLPAILGLQGRIDEAQKATNALLGKRPGYTCRQTRQDLFFCGNQDFIEDFVAGLRKAGVPD